MGVNLLPPAASNPGVAGIWTAYAASASLSYPANPGFGLGTNVLRATSIAPGGNMGAYMQLFPADYALTVGSTYSFSFKWRASSLTAPRSISIFIQAYGASGFIGQGFSVVLASATGANGVLETSYVIPVGTTSILIIGALNSVTGEHFEMDDFRFWEGTYQEPGPTAAVYVAFENEALKDKPTFTDISQYVKSVHTSRGRNSSNEDMGTGEMSAELDNEDGRFTPLRATSPYYPYVIPGRRVRVNAEYGVRARVTGGTATVASHTVGGLSVAVVSGTDSLRPNSGMGVSLRFYAYTLSGPARLVGARIEWLNPAGAVVATSDGITKLIGTTPSEFWVTADPPTNVAAVKARMKAVVGPAATNTNIQFESVVFGDEAEPVFDGHVERWPASLTDLSVTTITAYDGFANLAQSALSSPYEEELDSFFTPTQKALIQYYPLTNPVNTQVAPARWTNTYLNMTIGGGSDDNVGESFGGQSALPKGHGGSTGLEVKAEEISGPILLSPGASYAFLNAAAKFAISFWYSGNAPDTTSIGLFEALTTTSVGAIQVDLNPTGQIRAILRSNAGTYNINSGAGSVRGGTYFITVRWTGTLFQLWINGTLRASVATVVSFLTGTLQLIQLGHIQGSGALDLMGVGNYSHLMVDNNDTHGAYHAQLYAFGQTNYEDEFTPARISRVLSRGGWPASRVHVVEASTKPLISSEWQVKTSVLSEILNASRSSEFITYMSKIGDVRAKGPTELGLATTYATYSGPSAVEPGATGDVDFQRIVNEVMVSSSNGIQVIKVDSASQLTYGRATGELVRDLKNESDLSAAALAYITRYKDPQVWLSDLVFNPGAVVSHRSIIRADLQDRITAANFPASAPATSFDLRIEKIDHDMVVKGERPEWVTTVRTSPF